MNGLFVFLACNLSLAGNKLISGSHGFIEKDEEGKVWFHDTSTNGSLLNMSQKVNKDVGCVYSVRIEMRFSNQSTIQL